MARGAQNADISQCGAQNTTGPPLAIRQTKPERAIGVTNAQSGGHILGAGEPGQSRERF